MLRYSPPIPMGHHILSVLVAFAAYSILDLAKAVQKIAVERLAVNRAAGVLIWIGATSSTVVSSILLLYAVSIGSVLVVGAMGGTGLAAMTVFSVLVMKEQVRKREIAGVVAILLGPFFMASAIGIHPDVPLFARLYGFGSGIVFLYGTKIMFGA